MFGAVDPALDGVRRVELRQLESAVTVRRPHERDVDPDALEPDDVVDPRPLDRSRSVALTSIPSSTKKATAASRSSTTTPT